MALQQQHHANACLVPCPPERLLPSWNCRSVNVCWWCCSRRGQRSQGAYSGHGKLFIRCIQAVHLQERDRPPHPHTRPITTLCAQTLTPPTHNSLLLLRTSSFSALLYALPWTVSHRYLDFPSAFHLMSFSLDIYLQKKTPPITSFTTCLRYMYKQCRGPPGTPHRWTVFQLIIPLSSQAYAVSAKSD